MTKRLAQIEKIAERLVEGSLSRLFALGLSPQEVEARLVRAMEDNAEGNMAPDRYRVFLHPETLETLLGTKPDLELILANLILYQVAETGLDLYRSPVVELIPREDFKPESVSVETTISGLSSEQTQVLDITKMRERMTPPPDGSIYLIVDGGRHVSLTRPVYTLGRKLDCDIVLSDPCVSRRHAQLRWRFGRYVLYDLGSSKGTVVNGEPITEVVLEPGDVLTLGGVDIIYGCDSMLEGNPSEGDTTWGWSYSESPSNPVSPLP